MDLPPQVAPIADAGFVPLWIITVANGQTQITSANIAQAAGAPFITKKLTDIASNNEWTVAAGTADAITATYTPAITTLTDGLILFFRATGSNTTTTPTFAPNSLTAHTITKKGGAALAVGDIPAALAEVILIYNLAHTRWELLNPAVQVVGKTKVYGAAITSANISPSQAITPVAHGLGRLPDGVDTFLTCTASGGDDGYAQGRTIQAAGFGANGANANAWVIDYGVTDTSIVFGTVGAALPNKASFTNTSLTATSWSLTVMPYIMV